MADATPVAAAVVATIWAWQALLPPCIGALSGYQAIWGKFPANSRQALTKFGSWGYLVSRMAVPFVGYALWFKNQTPPSHSWIVAVAWGLGTEMVLRCRFYVGDKHTTAGQTEAVFKGVFDLVEWYQKLWLNHVGTQLASARNAFVADLVKGETDPHRAGARAGKSQRMGSGTEARYPTEAGGNLRSLRWQWRQWGERSRRLYPQPWVRDARPCRTQWSRRATSARLKARQVAPQSWLLRRQLRSIAARS